MTITSEAFWVTKGDVRLRVYRKFEGLSAEGKPVLFLVHGSSLSAMPGFDLRVPDRGSQYSMMDRCAEHGYDVWTMDHEGYGESDRTAGSADVRSGVDDLRAAMPLLRERTGREKFHFYGQSSGALRAALLGQEDAQWVDRLVLDALVWTGEGSPTLEQRRKRLAEWQSSNVRRIDKDSIRSIFTRDAPGTSEMIVAEAAAEAQLALGELIPTGTYLDMCANLPLIDPALIDLPVLIVRGEHDGIATMRDLTDFFAILPDPNRQLTVLPRSSHIAPFGLNAELFYRVIFDFLDR